MIKFKKAKALAVVAAVGLVGYLYSVHENKKDIAVVEETKNAKTTELPLFTMENTAGQTINLSSFKGKKVFVNIWATWCPPCGQEIPSIEKLYSQADTGKAAFILLSLDENFDSRKSLRQRTPCRFRSFIPQKISLLNLT